MLPPEIYANFMEALGIMGKGMLGIFVVMVLISVIVLGKTKLRNNEK